MYPKQVSACEISLHPRDSSRLDLSIPGQQVLFKFSYETVEFTYKLFFFIFSTCMSRRGLTVRGSSG